MVVRFSYRLVRKSDMATLEQTLRDALDSFWDQNVLPAPASRTVCDPIESELDSMSSCGVLLVLEEIIGFELEPEKVIRRGGYVNREQFLTELGEAVLHQVKERAK